jgi:hypothetical protein
MNRYFRILQDALYEQVRMGLDAAWGHVPPETCVDPAAVAPRDTQGRILLAVRPEFCEFAEVAAMLPELLANGDVEEIDKATYWESQPQAEF